MPGEIVANESPLNARKSVQQDLAFLFPGQGSQSLHMLSAAGDAFPVVAEVFAEASDALGYDLWALLQGNDSDTLNLTEYTQPALLASSVALWRVWRAESDIAPAAMAGHSLGEFSALCCAGSIKLWDAILLVRERGRFMQTAVPVGEGAMAAVLGLDDDAVAAICDSVAGSLGQVVQAVNYNSRGQVVIAGHTEAVAEATDRLKSAGAKRALPLPVSAPFHTSLMQPAGVRLKTVLDDIELVTPEIPVIHNVHAQYENDPQRIRELLVEQISSPVRWTACIGSLRKSGASRFVECGPGKVLGGLLRRIDKSFTCFYLENPDDLRAAVTDVAA